MRRITMPTTLPSTTFRTDQVIPWIGRTLLGAFLASVAIVCGLLVIHGPQLRAAAEAREASIVEQEDKAFCTKFGIAPETGRYAECAAGLKEIRSRYLERSVGESIL
jgi:hypothetical protein